MRRVPSDHCTGGVRDSVVGAEWGNVVPFSLRADQRTDNQREGFPYPVYLDPGVPPMLGSSQEQAFLERFEALGFEQVRYADRSEKPWRVVEGIEFRAITLVGALPAAGQPSSCC